MNLITRLVGAGLALLSCCTLASAQVGSDAAAFPSRPIRIVVPFPAGGPTDAIMRNLGERMRVALGQPLVVEYVTGASGSVGTGRVARAAPDGYTIVCGHFGTHATNVAVYQLNYDIVKDFAPIALLPRNPYLFVTRKNFPADTLTDQPETFYVAEVIREQIFHLTHQEVPYACAVRVSELIERKRPECLYILARIFVEHDSQKGIVIGKGGTMLKRIGAAARENLERFFGIKVYLELTVQVRRNWRRDDKALREFGFLLTS